jgi:hypothetical protein
MNTILKQLAAVASPRHPWAAYSDIIRAADYLEAADASGVTVMKSTGSERVDFPDGLTEGLYDYLAPWCIDSEKGLLAKGVLQNKLGLDHLDLECVLKLLRNEFGQCEEDWLPSLAKAVGFKTIADTCREALALERTESPRPDIRCDIYTTPRWDRMARRLSYGVEKWHFRDGAVMVFAVLDTLEANSWNAANVLPAARQVRFIATWRDIRDAVTVIKNKSRPTLTWSTTTDGVVRWRANV